jgi:hypothetical protein
MAGIGLVSFPVAKSYSFSIDCARQSMDLNEEVPDPGGREKARSPFSALFLGSRLQDGTQRRHKTHENSPFM